MVACSVDARGRRLPIAMPLCGPVKAAYLDPQMGE
jgi:hypothetical protein